MKRLSKFMHPVKVILMSIKQVSTALLLVWTAFQLPMVQAENDASVIGYWSLDELATDQSANKVDLNIVDHFHAESPPWIPKWTTGQSGEALNLPGSARIASTDHATALQKPSITLSAWVYPRSELADDQWESWRDWEWVAAQGDNYGLFLTPGNKGISFYIKDSTGEWSNAYSDDNSFEYDQWQHIAGSFDSANHTLTLYKNGIEVGTNTIDGIIEYSTGDGFTIGSMQNERNFNGAIDEVKVFGSALSLAQIEQLAMTSSSPSEDTTPPVITITIKGSDPKYIYIGTAYIDAGATAVDDVDGVVQVVTQNNVDIHNFGTYTVTYTAKDAANNVATATREVKVIRRMSRPGGYWSLDDIQGEMTPDRSASRIDLTVNNGASLITGRTGLALNLNGNNQDASTPYAEALQTSSVKIFAEVYPNLNPNNSWWEWIAAQGDNYGLYLTPENRGVNFYIKDVWGGWKVASIANGFKFNQWNFISGSFDQTTKMLKVRVNGMEASQAGGGIEYSTGDGFTIGSMQGQRYFDGRIDHVSIDIQAPEAEIPLPIILGKLNDTGVTKCGSGVGSNPNNNLDCAGTDPDGDPVPPGQDALFGRDANSATNNDSDGHAGFSFTKMSSSGVVLEDQTATSFDCVRDNVTGLIWEVKTTHGLHNKSDAYNWHNTDYSSNGGHEGYADRDGDICFGYSSGDPSSYCNTEAYITRVNTVGWCGATDWRLPTRKELVSLVDYSVMNPAIDTRFFPNTVLGVDRPGSTSNGYWTSSPHQDAAWAVYFNKGDVSGLYKFYSPRKQVRLVRGDWRTKH